LFLYTLKLVGSLGLVVDREVQGLSIPAQNSSGVSDVRAIELVSDYKSYNGGGAALLALVGKGLGIFIVSYLESFLKTLHDGYI
jgi:hypothetical protein